MKQIIVLTRSLSYQTHSPWQSWLATSTPCLSPKISDNRHWSAISRNHSNSQSDKRHILLQAGLGTKKNSWVKDQVKTYHSVYTNDRKQTSRVTDDASRPRGIKMGRGSLGLPRTGMLTLSSALPIKSDICLRNAVLLFSVLSYLAKHTRAVPSPAKALLRVVGSSQSQGYGDRWICMALVVIGPVVQPVRSYRFEGYHCRFHGHIG